MVAWARLSLSSGTLTFGLPLTSAVSTPWCTLMTKSLTAICLPAGRSANKIPPLCQMVPASFAVFSQPPVTGNVKRTATPPPSWAPAVPGSVAMGTMPFPSKAVAMPGAVVTVVSPPGSRIWAALVAVDADADAVPATGPTTRPAMVATTATRLNMRMSTPFRIPAALGRGSPAGIRTAEPCRMQSAEGGGGQGPADHAGLGVLGAPVERLERDVDARVIPQVHAGRHGERAGVLGAQVAEGDHADPVPGQQPGLIEAGSRGGPQGDHDLLLARGRPHHGGARGALPLRELRQRAQLDPGDDTGRRLGDLGHLDHADAAADPDDHPGREAGQGTGQPPARPGQPRATGPGSATALRGGRRF